MRPSPSPSTAGYRHAALVYSGIDEFVDRTAPFLESAIAADEPAMVVVSAEKIERLKHALGHDAGSVEFADMATVGSNPAMIIPAWEDFVDAHPGRRLRGIGEPVDADRGEAELVECQHHERLLNFALADADLFLLCPYDTDVLGVDVIAEAHRSHPTIAVNGHELRSAAYSDAGATAFARHALPDPPPDSEVIRFSLASLTAVRSFVATQTEKWGLDSERRGDLVLAVGEVAANSVRHGGGGGTLRVWRDADRVLCEVRDRGVIDDPLVDRRRPVKDQPGGYGLWLANRLCDLVQLRTGPAGTVLRLHTRT